MKAFHCSKYIIFQIHFKTNMPDQSLLSSKVVVPKPGYSY